MPYQQGDTGAYTLAAEKALGKDKTMALVNENGAGKSTLMRTLAGSVPVDRRDHLRGRRRYRAPDP
ncbi:hypothetical protein OG476_13335 [Streptomyces sp. NBC_01396]